MTEAANTKPEKAEDRLVGCEITLDPKKSGFFFDPTNNFTLGFGGTFEGHSDTKEITDNMDLTLIYKSIKAGTIRVIKKDKDITHEFGGTKFDKRPMQPLVDGVPDSVAREDRPLMNILYTNKHVDILRQISAQTNYATLERLMELEKMGQNPSNQPRVDIIDAIAAQMKLCPGIGAAREIKQDTKDVVKFR